MAKVDKPVDQVGDDPLGAAVEFRRHAFVERCDMGYAHFGPMCISGPSSLGAFFAFRPLVMRMAWALVPSHDSVVVAGETGVNKVRQLDPQPGGHRIFHPQHLFAKLRDF